MKLTKHQLFADVLSVTEKGVPHVLITGTVLEWDGDDALVVVPVLVAGRRVTVLLADLISRAQPVVEDAGARADLVDELAAFAHGDLANALDVASCFQAMAQLAGAETASDLAVGALSARGTLDGKHGHLARALSELLAAATLADAWTGDPEDTTLDVARDRLARARELATESNRIQNVLRSAEGRGTKPR